MKCRIDPSCTCPQAIVIVHFLWHYIFYRLRPNTQIVKALDNMINVNTVTSVTYFNVTSAEFTIIIQIFSYLQARKVSASRIDIQEARLAVPFDTVLICLYTHRFPKLGVQVSLESHDFILP